MKTAGVDFLRPQRAPMLGWVLLVLGVGSLAFVLWLTEQRAAADANAEQRAQAASQAQRQAKQQNARRVLTNAESNRLRAQTQMRLPWASSFRAIEAAAVGPVYLLGLSVDSQTGRLKFEAEAPSFDDAVGFVQALEASDALQGALLVSHEPVTDPKTMRVFTRFVATARWRLP